MKLFRAVIGMVVLGLLTNGTASAQAIAGSQLSGVVRDSSGGAIPGAEVTATKTDTGAIRTAFTGADGSYALPNLPVGPYQLKVVLQGFNTYIRDGIVLQVGIEPRDQRHARGRRDQRAGDGHRQLLHGRNPQHRRWPGDRQPAHHGNAAQRAAGHRADLPVRPRHGGARRRPQHQQELPDGHHLGRRRAGQRHHLHHGRRDAQRPVQQPEPADAVPRRAAGVQGRDQRAAGTLRPSRGLRGQPGHQVGHERDSRRRLRVPAQLPLHRAELLRAGARQPQSQPVRRHAGRADHQEQAVRVRRLPGAHREEQPGDDHQLRADAGDAERRLHRHYVAGVQRRPPDHPDRPVSATATESIRRG